MVRLHMLCMCMCMYHNLTSHSTRANHSRSLSPTRRFNTSLHMLHTALVT